MLGTWPLALTAYNMEPTVSPARYVIPQRDIGVSSVITKARVSVLHPVLLCPVHATREVEQEANVTLARVRFAHQPEFDEYEMTAFIDAE